MGTEKRNAQLLDLVEPQFITLTERPANKTTFKVLRDANGKEAVIRRREKAKRGDDNLISIELPVGTTRDEAEEYVEKFSLGDDYEISGDESTGFILVRKSGEEVDTVAVQLGDGIVANVASSVFSRSDEKTVTGVTLVGVEFSNEFSLQDIEEWMKDREVAYREDGVIDAEDDACKTVFRYKVPEDQELRKVSIEENVVGLVARTESTDIPLKVYRSVIEEAYGNWGWGSLDFSQAVADVEFSGLARDAIWILYDVLENILFYSYLPIDERKSLVGNACDQFSNYISSLVDALPREVAAQVRADLTNDQENVMAKTNDKTEDKAEGVKRTDDQVEGESTEGTATEGAEAALSRTDVEQIVADSISQVFTPERVKEVFGEALGMKRADEEEEIDPTLAAIQELTSSIKGLNDKVGSIEETQTALRSEMDELGNTTTKRSDDDDGEEGEEVNRSDGGSVFSGMFGRV
jgi:hypothetical protein